MTTTDGVPDAQPLQLNLGSRLDPAAVARMRAAAEPRQGSEPARPADDASDSAVADDASDSPVARLGLRHSTPREPVTIHGLCYRLGIKRALAEHLVQPYCTCSIGDYRIERCPHAQDLDL